MKYTLERSYLVLVFLVLFFIISTNTVHSAGEWGTRPLLSYFALTASLEFPLRLEAKLTPEESARIEFIAKQEETELRILRKRSDELILNPTLTLLEKRSIISASGYNQRVDAIIYLTDQRLRAVLPSGTYYRLIRWIEQRWPLEKAVHGLSSANNLLNYESAPRTYEIFASRYESKGGAYTAALPDRCLKFANGGLHTCDNNGYQAGAGYSVALRYKKSAGVMVGEAGPWNIDDNFWASSSDPQPRRMFADLPLGMPEAQAAFFNGYNGGLDQYGRKVTSPFAIDLAFNVAEDIGLPAKKNDWITVSFLWTDAWGSNNPKSSNQVQLTPGNIGSSPETIPLIATVTPAADGSITHLVKGGETLWAIALSYNTRLAQIQSLNNMGETIVIYEGQLLVIKEAGPTWTPDKDTGTQKTMTSAEISTTQALDSERRLATAATPKEKTSTLTPINTNSGVVSTPVATPMVSKGSPKKTESLFIPQLETSNFWISENAILFGGLVITGIGCLIIIIGWILSQRVK